LAAATWLSPDGSIHPAPLRAEGDYAVLDEPKTAQSGIYVAHFDRPDRPAATFAVNVDTAESDLAQVQPDELQNTLWPGAGFTRDAVPLESAAGSGTNERACPLPVDLLWGVWALLMFETVVGALRVP